VTVRTAVEVDLIARTSAGFVVASRGEQWEAPRLGLAVPPRVGAELVRSFRPKLAEALGRIAEVEVESVGVTLPKARCGLRECAFVVPVDDLFFSVVTRDPFPDEARRAFTFHFRPGVPRADKLRRMAEVLGVDEGELGEVIERRVTLPSPRVGHGDTVADIDRSVDGEPLAVTGNFFAGLAIEDCIQRSFSEWARLAGEASEGA
jgi:UDP-galactopyranose mutase